MVEKGKRNFSRGNAIKIMRKIISMAKEKEIDLNLDEEYMARDVREDVEMHCLRRVEAKASMEECHKLLEIAEEHKVPYAISKIYKRMGEIQLFNQEAVQAFISYSNSLEILNNNNLVNDKPLIFNNMGVCKLMLLDYEEAAHYFSNSLLVAELTGNYSAYNKTLFNLTLAYSNLKNIPDTLKTIERCIARLDKYKEYNIYLKVKIMEAYCYSENEDYKTSLSIYYDLENGLKNTLTDEEKVVLANVYNNMASVLLLNNKFKESEEYFDKSLELRNEYSKDLLSHTLITKSKLYKKCSQQNNAIICLQEGIELCKEYNDYEYWNIALNELEEIYNDNNNYDNLRWLYLQYIELSFNNQNENTRIYGYNKLINLELRLNNLKEAREYSDKLNAYIEEIQSNISYQW